MKLINVLDNIGFDYTQIIKKKEKRDHNLCPHCNHINTMFDIKNKKNKIVKACSYCGFERNKRNLILLT